MNVYRDPYYNDLDPEERIEKMQQEYDTLEIEIERDRAALDQRRRHHGNRPARFEQPRIANAEQRIADKDARHSWLHGQLYPILIIGEARNLPGYSTCRACGTQTGDDAPWARASLCTRCWEAWTTPSSPTAADTQEEGTQ